MDKLWHVAILFALLISTHYFTHQYFASLVLSIVQLAIFHFLNLFKITALLLYTQKTETLFCVKWSGNNVAFNVNGSATGFVLLRVSHFIKEFWLTKTRDSHYYTITMSVFLINLCGYEAWMCNIYLPLKFPLR